MILRIVLAILAVLAALIVAVVIAVMVLGWDWLRGPVEARLSDALDREVRIAEPLEVQWRWSFIPTVRLGGVTVADEDWTGEEHFIEVDDAVIRIALLDLLRGRVNLPEASVTGMRLRLHSDEEGENNWDIGGGGGDTQDIPVVGSLQIDDSQIVYLNERRNVRFSAYLNSIEAEDDEEGDRLEISGDGELQGAPIAFEGRGDNVLTLRDPSRSFGFQLDVRGGDSRFTFDGELGPGGSFRELAGRLTLEGDNLREIYDYSGIPTPDTAPYNLALNLSRDGDVWRARDIEGIVGESDLQGRLDYDTGRDRPYVNAALYSQALDFGDIGVLIGAPAIDPDDMTESEIERAQARALRDEQRIFPRAPLDIDRISGVDGQLRFSSRRVLGIGEALTDVQTVITLDDRILRMDPLNFGFRGGQLNSRIEINARGEITITSADGQFADIRLEDFIPDDRVAGTFSGAITLVGEGDNIRAAMATSNGRITALLDEGAISRSLIELIGLDLLDYLFADDELVATTCGLADIVVEDGIGRPEALSIVTPISRIDTEGEFDFRREMFDLRIHARDRTPTIGSLGGPIILGGRFRDPQVGVGEETILRGVAAAALGIFVAPLAALLGTVQLDVSEGGACAELFAEEGPGQLP